MPKTIKLLKLGSARRLTQGSSGTPRNESHLPNYYPAG